MNFKTKYYFVPPLYVLITHTLLALGRESTKEELGAETTLRNIIEDFKSTMVIEKKSPYMDKPIPILAPLHMPGLIANGSYKSPL